MSTKTILQNAPNGFTDNGETAAQYNVGLLVTVDGSTVTAVAADGSDILPWIMTEDQHPDKGCFDWDEDNGLIDSGDTVRVQRLTHGMKVNLWLDPNTNAVSEGDDLQTYGSTGEAGTVIKGSTNAKFYAAEDKDSPTGDPVRIEAYVK